jgi:Carboxypeptidase regulatory-like domain/TonB dependent receptor-like, beta-barrel
VVLVWAAVLLAVPSGATAIQECTAADSVGRLASVVARAIDAQSAVPLVDAVVWIQSIASQCRVAVRTRVASRTSASDESGEYVFARLPAGRYRLGARRLGYDTVVVEVDVDRGGPLRVTLGLTKRPVVLDPIEGGSPPPGEDPVLWGGPGWADAARVAWTWDRQRRFLSTDVRLVTESDAHDAAAFGEADVFRGVQQLPGVTTRDDYTAELWSRGAPWSHTRVYFDGLPLFNPMHTLGVFSGVASEAIGSAVFEPGVRSASEGEGAAGVVSLTSRTAVGSGGIGGRAGISPVSARLSLERRSANGKTAWMVAARRSYIDGVSSAVASVDDRLMRRVPYAFADVVGRFDWALGPGRSLELSGLWQEDRLRGDIPEVLRGNRGVAGNRMGRATLVTRVGAVDVRSTVGTSVSALGVDTLEQVFGGDTPPDLPATNASHRYSTVKIELAPAGRSVRPSWNAGVELVLEQVRYDGARMQRSEIPLGSDLAARGIAGTAGDALAPLLMNRLEVAQGSARTALWVERNSVLGDHVTVQGGLRVESGSRLANAGVVRLAPRISVRYGTASDRLIVSAGLARFYQYTQQVGAMDAVRSGLRASELWVMASDTIPAIATDIATLGTEYWLGNAWLGSINVFGRQSRGVVSPDPRPGYLGDPLSLVGATTRARGMEVSLRKLAGIWTWSGAYSYTRSTTKAGRYEFASSAERRHVLNLASAVRVARSLRVSAAFTAASGAPFTRVVLARYGCDLNQHCTQAGPTRIEAPNAERGPPYSNLNVGLGWSRAYRGWALDIYLQVQNALGQSRPVTYNSSCQCMAAGADPWTGSPEPVDAFEARMPRVPVVGVRVSF